jgi:hypothetical protein
MFGLPWSNALHARVQFSLFFNVWPGRVEMWRMDIAGGSGWLEAGALRPANQSAGYIFIQLSDDVVKLVTRIGVITNHNPNICFSQLI